VDWVNGAFPQVFPSRADTLRGAVPYARSEAFRAPGAGSAVRLHPCIERDDAGEAAQVIDLIRAAQGEPALHGDGSVVPADVLDQQRFVRRDRLGAQALLVKHAQAGTHPVAGFSREAMDALLRYDFPGNVRELENIIQGAIALSRHETITTDDLPVAVRAQGEENGLTYRQFEGSMRQQVDALERGLIEEALREEGGVQYRAAERLGISERTLRYKLEKHGMR